MKKGLLLLLCIWGMSPLSAQFLEKESSTSLAPKPPHRPEIFDLDFLSPPAEVIVDMRRLHVHLNRSVKLGDNMTYQIFNGTPPFVVQGNKSFMKFLDNRLIGMDFRFEPTFENYLLLKHQILNDLDGVYSVKKEHDVIDPFIKSELLNAKGNSIGKDLEEKLQESILEGKTIFYMPLEDKEKKVKAALYWTPSTKRNKTILGISYSWVEGEKALEKAKEAKAEKNGILPK